MTTGLGDAVGRVMLDASGVKSAMQQAQNDARTGFRAMGDSIKSVGDSLSNTGRQISLLTAPITGLALAGVKAFASFDDALTEIAARTGATADEMDKVRKVALKMGKTTKYSATQAAEGMLQLLSSGYDLSETFAALPAILDLAAAGNTDLGYTADVVTDILAMFNLEATDAKEVTDALAKAAGASSAEIGDLAEGFGDVGPIAAQFGLSVKETAAILAIFSENGVKGAEAGTQLKSMLTHLSSPTKEVQKAWDALGLSMFEANGNIKPIPLLMEQLSDKLKTLTPKERLQAVQALAGSFGQIGATILTSNMSVADMVALMDKQADASTVARARLKSLSGMFGRLRSAISTALITAMEPFIEDFLKPGIQAITDFTSKITDWMNINPQLTDQIVRLLAIVIAVGPALMIAGRLIAGIGLLVGLLANPLVQIGIVVAALAAAWENDFLGIRSAIEPVVDTLSYIVGWLSKAYSYWAAQGGVVSGVIGAFQALFYVFEDGKTTFFSKLFEALGMSTESAQALGLAIVNLSGKFVAAITQVALFAKLLWDSLKSGDVEGIKAALTGVFNGVRDAVVAAWPMIKLVIGQIAESLWNWVKTVGAPLLIELGLLIAGLLQWIIDQAPVVLNQLGEWVSAFINWVIPAGEGLLLKLPDLLSDLLKWVLDVVPDIAEQLLDWATEFVEWAGDAIPPLLEKLGELLAEVIEWVLGTFIPEVLKEAPGIVDAFLQFVEDAINDVGPALLDFLKAVDDFIFNDMIPAVLGFGEDIAGGIIDGIIQGINNLAPDLEKEVTSLLKDILPGWAEDALGIDSPSKVAAGWGEAILAGLQVGLTSTLALAGQMGLVLLVVTGAGMLISNAGTTTGSNFILNLTNAINTNAYVVSGAMGIFQTYANGLAQTMTSAGNNAGYMLVAGLATGIYNNVSAAVAAVSYLGYSLQAALRSALQMYSPSKVFEKLGGFIPEGLAEGIAGKAQTALDAMSGLAVSLTPIVPEMALAGAGTNNYQSIDRSTTQQISVVLTPEVIRQYPDARNYADVVERALKDAANSQGGGITRS